MAGDWIKFELATLEKPEVWAISDALDVDPDAVVGKLLRVWGWFDQQTEKGNAPSVTKKLLDRSAGVTGFCNAMVSVGWMLEDESGISLPHFGRHNGKTAKNRALTAKRVASHKKSNAKDNGEVTQGALPDALPREEKRREDSNNELPNGNSCAEPESAPPSTDVKFAPVFEIPTNRKGETFWVTEEKIEEYQETYPAVDVMQEVRKARQWSIDNPAKRKTLNGMPKFLNNWLGRVQDNPPRQVNQPIPFTPGSQRTRDRSVMDIVTDTSWAD